MCQDLDLRQRPHPKLALLRDGELRPSAAIGSTGCYECAEPYSTGVHEARNVPYTATESFSPIAAQ